MGSLKHQVRQLMFEEAVLMTEAEAKLPQYAYSGAKRHNHCAFGLRRRIAQVTGARLSR